MQQASFLSGGLYLRIGETQARDLLQLLHMHFLADLETRALLNVPMLPVEFAYMCSVCLSLSCEIAASCPTCGTSATMK
eukprot:gene21792-27861_t